jgi:hypothetical protein
MNYELGFVVNYFRSPNNELKRTATNKSVNI